MALVGLVLSACSDGLADRSAAQAEPTAATATTESHTVDGAAEVALADADVGRVSLKAADSRNTAPRDGEDWPCFLGPRADGVSGEKGLRFQWSPSGPPRLWSRRVGTGYSAPSVIGNRLVVHHRLGDEEIVQCVTADEGEPLWQHSYTSDFEDPYGYNNGPRCSPLLTPQLCYTLGASGKLKCLELATGELRWERDLHADFRIPKAFFGVGATPILEGDRLIVLVGGQPNSGVVAFNAADGKTIWESVGRDTWNGVTTDEPGNPKYEWTGDEMVVSYSSPIAVTIAGHRHVLCLMRQGLVSLDPADGNVRFRYWFRARDHESVNAARPVVVGNQIFLSAAYRVGSALLEVDQNDPSQFREVWRNPRVMLTHWSTAIEKDGYVYGFSGRHENEATLRCVEWATGKLAWETTGFAGQLSDLGQDPQTGRIVHKETGERIPWPFYGRGSAIFADGKVSVLGERGTLATVEGNPKEWVEISRCDVDGIRYPAWAAPVLSRKRLFLRSESHLVCLDLAADSDSAASLTE